MKQTVDIPFCIQKNQMLAFAEISGDRNPVHLDPVYARSCGFPGPVVYGALLIAVVSRLLGMELPGPGCIWHSVSMKFKSPLYVGEQAVLTGTVTYVSEALQILRLDLAVRRGEEVLASGQAQAGWRVEVAT